MSLDDFSDVLFRERHLLELLLFKLEEEQLLLEAGRTRWLAHASREVETVLDELGKVELARATELARVGTELGLGDGVTALATVVQASPPVWRSILSEHQRALRALMDEVMATAASNRRRLREGYEVIRQALASVGAPAGTQVTQ